MALKLEHKCSRCNRLTAVEVQDVQAASQAEALEKKRATALADIQEFLAAINPDLLPDLLVVRRGGATIAHANLCAPEDEAKRSCAERVGFLMEECATLGPRKPKTKKTPPATPKT